MHSTLAPICIAFPSRAHPIKCTHACMHPCLHAPMHASMHPCIYARTVHSLDTWYSVECIQAPTCSCTCTQFGVLCTNRTTTFRLVQSKYFQTSLETSLLPAFCRVSCLRNIIGHLASATNGCPGLNLIVFIMYSKEEACMHAS